MRKKLGQERLWLRLEGGWVFLEITSPELKTPLTFPVGNLDYVLQRGEPFLLQRPELLNRIRTFIRDTRENALSSLPAHVWEPVAVDPATKLPWLDRVLFFFLSKEDAAAFPGDLAEQYGTRVKQLGARGARVWYVKELATLAAKTTLRRLFRLLYLIDLFDDFLG